MIICNLNSEYKGPCESLKQRLLQQFQWFAMMDIAALSIAQIENRPR